MLTFSHWVGEIRKSGSTGSGRRQVAFSKNFIKREVTHIHSFWMGECAYIASELASRYSISHYCTLMGQDVLVGNQYFKKVRDLPPLITLSKYHASSLKRNYGLDSKIVPWGILPIDQSLAKDINVIGVGNLVPGKRFDEFIEVIEKLKVYFPEIKGAIVGEGPLKSMLKRQIKLAGLSDSVSLMGGLSYMDTYQLIAQAKILLHLSDFESFGMVTIEALSVRTWVVCRSVGIANEIEETIRIGSMTEAVVEIRGILAKDALPKPIYYPIGNTINAYLELIG
ncbi:MAG: glycosyltransferase [Saprospiraceae bacterium]|nr:glycosyltransferase [Saprospiraceae bacterium]